MTYRDEAFPNIPFNHNSYDVETKDLTHEEKGIYVDLMVLFWRRKCNPIPNNDDKISRMLGCTLDRWKRKLRPAIEHLFVISEEGWRHERMEQRWAGIEEKSAISSRNGKLGGRPANRQTADTFPNPLTNNAERISQTQTANLLENKETEKAVAFDQVKPDESHINIESKKEESKKESPLSPPNGGMANGVLFPVQEVQHAPVRDAKGPRRKKHQSLKDAPKASPEIEAAFVEFKATYPRRNHAHTWTEAKPLFVEAMESGVPGELLIRTADTYAKIVRSEGKENTSVVADARTWLNQRRWENYADFQPVSHPKTQNGYNGNVTPLRNGTNGQQMPKITRGGIQY
jgi:uncharacterized protein YdaU (DUF1376 family)